MNPPKIWTIYKYTSPSGKIYAGQTEKTLSQRAGGSGYRYRACIAFYRAITKYGWNNLQAEIICCARDEDSADALETYFIAAFDSTNPSKGYNLAPGGNTTPSQKGKPKSAETRERMRAAQQKLNYRHTAEARQKMSDAKKGKPLSQEHKQRLSAAQKGRERTDKDASHLEDMHVLAAETNRGNKYRLGKTHTLETREKLSAAHKGKTWKMIDGKRVWIHREVE